MELRILLVAAVDARSTAGIVNVPQEGTEDSDHLVPKPRCHRRWIARPSKPAAAMMIGSGTFHFMRIRNVAKAIPHVQMSRIECLANTNAAPAIAPVAAAVTP